MNDKVDMGPTMESIHVALNEQNKRLGFIEEKIALLERQSHENAEKIEELCLTNGELKKVQEMVEDLYKIMWGDEEFGIPNMVKEFREMSDAFKHIRWISSSQTLVMFIIGLVAIIGWITTLITH